MFFLSSPLEQFQILPIISIHIGNFDFSITNATIILAFGLGCFIFVLNSILSKQGNFYVAHNEAEVNANHPETKGKKLTQDADCLDSSSLFYSF